MSDLLITYHSHLRLHCHIKGNNFPRRLDSTNRASGEARAFQGGMKHEFDREKALYSRTQPTGTKAAERRPQPGTLHGRSFDLALFPTAHDLLV